MIDENKVLEFIKSEYTWEQIIYEIIAWEGLDPWDLDVCKLTDGFLQYLKAMKELDFRIPAKYIMVAAILLKMKAEYLRAFKEQVTGEAEQKMQEGIIENHIDYTEGFHLDPLNIPPRREPVRGIIVSELVRALKKALGSYERKMYRIEKLKKDVEISPTESINERIKKLYAKINNLLARLKKKEVEFSKIVVRWEREEIVNNFIPLIHLEQQQKVRTRQEKLFDEIWVKKREDDGK
ncbi:MAG: segregation/condensation protein A [Candidatus Aenigmatarchaeota archaeon]